MSLLKDCWVKAGPRSLDYEEFERRFWSRTATSGTCIIWTGGRQGKYGAASLQGRNMGAHRVAYWMKVGPLVEGLEIDHICNVPLCINPDHLQQIDGHANWSRSSALTRENSLKTHCKHGHEFTEENTRLTAKGRDCRACNRDRYWRNRERLNKQKRDKRALLNPPTEGETDADT